VGVSWNKIFAKLGSDYKKPDATTVISRENYRELVWPMDAGALLYVGKSAQAALREMGIRTIGQLAAADPERLARRLGKLGRELMVYARGEESSPVRSAYEKREVKSVGNGTTFPRDLRGMEEIAAGIGPLAESVARRLRKNGLWCRTVQVQIRDPGFRTISRQKPLERPSHLSREIREAALELVRESWDPAAPVRMLTVTGANLVDETGLGEQLSLFTDPDRETRRRKQEALEETLDRLKARYQGIGWGTAAGGGDREEEDS